MNDFSVTLSDKDTVEAMKAQGIQLIPISVECFERLFREALEVARRENKEKP